jgi:hypothetical protein
MYRKRYFRNSTFEAIAHIEPVVKKNGLTMLETALRWVVWHGKLNVAGVDYSKIGEPDRKGNDGIIIGVSSVKQLEGNLKDLEKGPLPEEVVKTLDEAWIIAKAGTSKNHYRPLYAHLLTFGSFREHSLLPRRAQVRLRHTESVVRLMLQIGIDMSLRLVHITLL